MQKNTLMPQNDSLQKTLLRENKLFLDAVKKRLPLEEILKQYEKVRSLFDTIQQKEGSYRLHSN